MMLNGAWYAFTTNPMRYGSNYRLAATSSGPQTACASWRATAIGAGRYTVYAWWPMNWNLTMSAKYVIKDGTAELAAVPVNQSADGGRWVLLGTHDFAQGGPAVELHNGQTKSSPWSSEAYVSADAVRFVPVADP